MAVSDRRYATQIRDTKGKTYFFDDVGCALEWLHNHKEVKKHRIWVRDKSAKEWIDAETSYWTTGAQTPMGYGFAASKTKVEDAITFKDVHAKIKAKSSTRNHQHQ